MSQLPLVAIYNCADADGGTAAAVIGGIIAAVGESSAGGGAGQSESDAPADCHLDGTHAVLLSTKYYTAHVALCAVDGGDERDSELNQRCGALIIYFDGEHLTALGDKWKQLHEILEPSVKLALCQVMADSKRDEINAWCLENEFEVIELSPSAESQCEADEYHELTSYARCVQALAAVQWPNAVFLHGHAHGGAQGAHDGQAVQHTAHCVAPSTPATAAAAAASAPAENEPPDSLDELFGQFAEMKARAEQLSGDDRRHYAEHMAIKFYEALRCSDSDTDHSDA